MTPMPDDSAAGLRPLFFARSNADVAGMREALERGDFTPIEQLAHRMVGAAGSLELFALAQAAREVQRAARAADAPRCRGVLEALAQCLDRSVKAAEPGAAS